VQIAEKKYAEDVEIKACITIHTRKRELAEAGRSLTALRKKSRAAPRNVGEARVGSLRVRTCGATTESDCWSMSITVRVEWQDPQGVRHPANAHAWQNHQQQVGVQ
jgi:hypothetical protein